jgi:Domain of unknown function (DUF5666)
MQRILASISLVICLIVGSPGWAPAGDKEEREGGIVGTGIVGTITELGSIYVNGQHIRFSEDLSVASPLGNRPASLLVPGETVIVEAARKGDAWYAGSIKAYLPIIGPVSFVAPRRLAVMGVLIDIPDDATSIADFVGAKVMEGDWIAVSGLWKEDDVAASRIEKITGLSMASVIGTYRSDGAGDRVGAVRIRGVDVRHARPLDVLTVQGTPTPDGLNAETVAVGLFTGPVGEVLVEGYLSQPDIQGAYTVQGSGLLSYVANPTMTIDPGRGLFCGIPQGVTKIERVLDLPEALSPRDDRLREFHDSRTLPCIEGPGP